MSQLEKTQETGVVVYKPLVHYPDLKENDIIESPNLSDLDRQVLLASLNNPKIRTLVVARGETGQSNSECYDQLVDIVGLAIWTMGITENSMPKEEQKLFIPVAIEEIKTFPNLTIEDVRIAFNRGARRKYGTIINGSLNPTLQMSIVTVHIWLTQYTEETKQEAMLKLKYVKPLALEKGEVTEEQKLKNHNIWLEHVYKKFEEHKQTNRHDYYDFGNKLYIYLKKLNLISLDEKQQQKIWDLAVNQLKKEYHPKNGRNFGSRIDMKLVHDALKMDEIDKKYHDLVIIKAKKMTIRYFFIKLIRSGKHIRDVIEDAQKLLIKGNHNG
jgi:hypothetical protein